MSPSPPPTTSLTPASPPVDVRVRFLRSLAWWMDSAIVIPGTRIRFGLDSLIGLIPGMGDVAGLVIGSLILAEAVHRGAPHSILVRMLWNLGRDSVVGTIPVVGDIHDVVFRANQRNMELLEAHCRDPRGTRGTGMRWLVAMGLGLVAVTAATIALAWLVLRTLVTLLP